jgi:DNA-binding transcriptional MerR regulator
MAFKIKEWADAARISVRMLRHYDKIGLLNPSSMTESGYRLYEDQDLKKLIQILFFKELDFSLKEIKSFLEETNLDTDLALMKQEQLLIKKRDRLDAIIKALQKMRTEHSYR